MLKLSFNKGFIQQFVNSGHQYDHTQVAFERRIIDQILDAALIVESGVVDLQEIEVEPDDRWEDLLDWFTNEKGDYLGEALREGGCTETFELFQRGQSLHHQYIKDELIEALQAFEPEPEEEEEEKDNTLEEIKALDINRKTADISTFVRKNFYVLSLGKIQILLKPGNEAEMWLDDELVSTGSWDKEKHAHIKGAIYDVVKRYIEGSRSIDDRIMNLWNKI